MSNCVYVVIHDNPFSREREVKGVFDSCEDAEQSIKNEYTTDSNRHNWSIYLTSKNKIRDSVFICRNVASN